MGVRRFGIADHSFDATYAALKCVRENSVVPLGLGFFGPLFTALKRWAKFVRPFVAGFKDNSFHWIAPRSSSRAHTEGPLFHGEAQNYEFFRTC
jgi:hypothetical protein